MGLRGIDCINTEKTGTSKSTSVYLLKQGVDFYEWETVV